MPSRSYFLFDGLYALGVGDEESFVGKGSAAAGDETTVCSDESPVGIDVSTAVGAV